MKKFQKTYELIFIFSILIVIISTCKKDEEVPDYGNKIDLGSTQIDSSTIDYRSVTVKSKLNSSRDNMVISLGHCWSLNEDPSIADQHDTLTLDSLDQNGYFTSKLDNLIPGKKYYIVPYLQYPLGYAYGEKIELTSKKTGRPVVKTELVLNVTFFTAECQGMVVQDSGIAIKSMGICWKMDGIPLIAEGDPYQTYDSAFLNTSYICQLSNLKEHKRYYVAAYAENDSGWISYGDTLPVFTTPFNPPTVWTDPNYSATYKSAICKGSITGFGSSDAIVEKGIYWRISGQTTYSQKIDEDTTSNIINITLKGLEEHTTYDYYAYAKNSYRDTIGLGLEEEFSTLSYIPPEVKTESYSDLTYNSITCNGQILDSGSEAIETIGIYYRTKTSEEWFYKSESFSSEYFSINLVNLDMQTDYWYKAFASNTIDSMAWGDSLDFQTLNLLYSEVRSDTVFNITGPTAQFSGEVINAGNDTIFERGICYSKFPDSLPEFDDNHVSVEGEIGIFDGVIEGLDVDARYYYRAFAKNNKEGYGYEATIKSFDAIVPIGPTVITHSVDSITKNSAKCTGEVTDIGSHPLKERGIIWGMSDSTNLNFDTYIDKDTVHPFIVGEFTGDISELDVGTRYFAKAYAINEVIDTAYGVFRGFNTLDYPNVTTLPVPLGSITSDSAYVGGEVIDEGGGTVYERGVCWDDDPDPTIDDSYLEDEYGGIGEFFMTITGLEANTQYYVRAYAINKEVGLAYGDTISFKTDFENCGIVSFEGKEYKTVVIGTQCWFRENLDVGTRIDSTVEQTDNDTIQKYCYRDEISYCNDYGGLYIWDEAMNYKTNEGAQGICPVGWHIFTKVEVETLVNFLGSFPGEKMKETGTDYWEEENATNISGFSGRGGGFYESDRDRVYQEIKIFGKFWSSTLDGLDGWPYFLRLYYSTTTADIPKKPPNIGHSIRCIKD